MLGIVFKFWLWLSYYSYAKATSILSSRDKNAYMRCLLKIRYDSELECTQSISQNKNGADKFYKCAFCKGWHKTKRQFKEKYAVTHNAIRAVSLWKIYESRGNAQGRRECSPNQSGRPKEDVHSQVDTET